MKHQSGKLFCFSPPVMIATFTIEIILAIYVIFRYKMNEVGRLAVAMLVSLATFQLAEYMVCGSITADSMLWSRIGYVAITTLPPLGLHLTYVLAGAKKRPLLIPAYVTGAGFTAFFILAPSAFSGHACLGNYVIFQVAKGMGALFGAYYYLWLAVTLLLGWRFMKQVEHAKQRRAIGGLMAGYAIFIIPAVAADLLSPGVIHGMPSIMCGFAVILALILVFVVLPNGAQKKAAA
jgi:hypothetical protein